MGILDLFKKNRSLKQTIVMRNDLSMGKGKIAAQASHASLSSFLRVRSKSSDIAENWLNEGQKKIVLKVDSERELVEFFQKCKDAGIPCELIMDAGHTQVASGTKTCFGAGPWYENEIDKVLGKLKLL
ncbi:MAG: peptidyl-tRNA hydrolase Pth2 [Candidatus Micrarchaeota archaeon]